MGVLAAARNPAASGTAYGRRAAVDILKTNNVVFAEVGAALISIISTGILPGLLSDAAPRGM